MAMRVSEHSSPSPSIPLPARVGWDGMRGELLQRTSDAGAAGQAEACYQQALDVASEQSAKSWELRAAMSYGAPAV